MECCHIIGDRYNLLGLSAARHEQQPRYMSPAILKICLLGTLALFLVKCVHVCSYAFECVFISIVECFLQFLYSHLANANCAWNDVIAFIRNFFTISWTEKLVKIFKKINNCQSIIGQMLALTIDQPICNANNLLEALSVHINLGFKIFKSIRSQDETNFALPCCWEKSFILSHAQWNGVSYENWWQRFVINHSFALHILVDCTCSSNSKMKNLTNNYMVNTYFNELL